MGFVCRTGWFVCVGVATHIITCLYTGPVADTDIASAREATVACLLACRCDPYKDAVLPEAPAELVNELSKR